MFGCLQRGYVGRLLSAELATLTREKRLTEHARMLQMSGQKSPTVSTGLTHFGTLHLQTFQILFPKIARKILCHLFIFFFSFFFRRNMILGTVNLLIINYTSEKAGYICFPSQTPVPVLFYVSTSGFILCLDFIRAPHACREAARHKGIFW